MDVEEVTVRELRQNLSVHLRRVQEGATLAVTNRGTRVAVLAPIGPSSRLDRLVAEGRVAPASQPWGEPTVPAPGDAAEPTALTDALLAARDEESR
jgi:prevent-host-death family protein